MQSKGGAFSPALVLYTHGSPMMLPRQRYSLPLPGRAPLMLGERTLVMGILNVTPDSFADDGVLADPAAAIARGLEMIAEGADIIDVGGESTRPGAEMVPEAEELRRVLPVIEGLVAAQALVSIDTYKAVVAREAVARGASIVNDVSALAYDRGLAATVAESGAGLIVMHNRGRSREMYREAAYTSVTAEISEELRDTIAVAIDAGVRRESIVIDPGFGFAKHARHTYTALAELERFAALDRPILSGPSRKSFLNAALGPRPPANREWGTAAAVTASILFGAHIVRVHGVREMADVARVADRILAAGSIGASSRHAEKREPDR